MVFFLFLSQNRDDHGSNTRMLLNPKRHIPKWNWFLKCFSYRAKKSNKSSYFPGHWRKHWGVGFQELRRAALSGVSDANW